MEFLKEIMVSVMAGEKAEVSFPGLKIDLDKVIK